jgi:mono/diheme cytochrome c family protein
MKWIKPSYKSFIPARPWLAAAVAAAVLAVGGAAAWLYWGRPAADEGAGPTGPGGRAGQLAAGKALYLNYCQACHGETGDGNGPAARYLYPKPRNFRTGKFRLVTTVNRIASDDDLLRVITRGMPGSAMFPFAHLGEDERRALVAYVRHLTRKGLEDLMRQAAAAEGKVLRPAHLARLVDPLVTPGKPIQVPDNLPPYGPESIARGRQSYGPECAACHGKTGKGEGAQSNRDEDGYLALPRDYTRGIFKGGRETRQLYARILVGMPGGPMIPARESMKPQAIGDLINFIKSLSDPSAQAQVEHKRTRLLVKRVAETLPDKVSDAAWKSAPAARVVVTPLWWRNSPEPDLEVAGLHDGKALALRLTWKDPTCNDRPVRPQDFEDMAAVQLFRGKPEPFLGMGTADKPLDVWLWRASWRGGSAGFPDVNSTYPNMVVDFYPPEKFGKGGREPFLTAKAAGNPLADPGRAFTGGNLRARGFGTLTMRPRVSQVVSAAAEYKGGRWTVVLRRPLRVNKDAGLALAPGDKLSVAFALWDGAAHDRNGQKLVSIWHDLELE